MYKKVLLSIVCLCIGLMAKAADTDISQYESAIYAKKLTAMAGSTAKLSILMKNKSEVPNLQFDICLPEGVTIAEDSNGKSLIELSSERLSASSDNTVASYVQSDGAMRVIASSQTNTAFTGNDGEIITITLNISNELSDGDYPIIIKNTVISYKTAETYKPGEVESTLSVGKPEYSEGFSVQMAPINLDVDGEIEDYVLITAVGDITPLKSVEYDLVYPNEWADSGLFTAEKANKLKTNYTITVGDYVNGATHVSYTANRESYYIGTTTSVEVAKITIVQTDGETLTIPTGIYPIQITNIVATDADGNKYYAAPTTTYVKVGEPTEGEITLEGHVTEDVTNALANETSLKMIDMSKVVSIDGSLTLRDKCDLIAPKYDVPVSVVTYKRDVTNKWGTVCLPYDVTSSTAIQYYKLKEVGETQMTFEPVTTVTAGTPAVFRLLDENVTKADMSTADAVLKAGDKSWTGDVAQWEMKGTYSNITINPLTEANNIYYIATNKVLYANLQFNVAAYRGWFETPKSASSNSKVYSVGFGDDDTTGIDLIEKENGEIDMIFDISGKQLPQSKKGVNIINNKKVFVK